MCKMYKQMFNKKIIRIIFVIWLIRQQQLTVCVAGQKTATTTITTALPVIADVQHTLLNMRAAGLKQNSVMKIDDVESDSGTRNRNTITSKSPTTINNLIGKNNAATQTTLKRIYATPRNAFTTNFTKILLLAEATEAANIETATNSNRWSANVTTMTPLPISFKKPANNYNNNHQIANTENILSFPHTNAIHAGGLTIQNVLKSPETRVSGKTAHNSYHSKIKNTSALFNKYQTPLTDLTHLQHKAESTITKTTVHTSDEEHTGETVSKARQTILNNFIRNNNLNNKTVLSLQKKPTNEELLPRILKDFQQKHHNNKATAVLIKKGKFLQSANEKSQATSEIINKESGNQNFVKVRDKAILANVNATNFSLKGNETIYHGAKEKSFQKISKTGEKQQNDNKVLKTKVQRTLAQEKLLNITKKANKLRGEPETISQQDLYLTNISSKAFYKKRDSSEDFTTQILSSELLATKKPFLKDIFPKETSLKNLAIQNNSSKALSTTLTEIDHGCKKGVKENNITAQELQPSGQVLTTIFPIAFSLKAWEKVDSKSKNKINNSHNENPVISKYASDASVNENTSEISGTYENSFKPANYKSSMKIVNDSIGALLADKFMSSSTKKLAAQKLLNFTNVINKKANTNIKNVVNYKAKELLEVFEKSKDLKVPLKPDNQKILIKHFNVIPETSTVDSNILTITKHDLNVIENIQKPLRKKSLKLKEKPQEMLADKNQINVSNKTLHKNPEAKKEISLNSQFLRQKRLKNNLRPEQSSKVRSQFQTENYTEMFHNNLLMKNNKTANENNKTETPPNVDAQSVGNINEIQNKFRNESVELEIANVRKLEFIDEQKQLPSNTTAIGNGNNVMTIKNNINTKQLDGKISQNIHHIDNGNHVVVGEFNAINAVTTTEAAEFETTIPSKELEGVTTTKRFLSTDSTKDIFTPTAVIEQNIFESQTTLTTALAPPPYLTMRSLNVDNESFENTTPKSFTTANGPLSIVDLVNTRLNTVVEGNKTIAPTYTTTSLMQLVSTASTNETTTTPTKLPNIYATTMSSFASPSTISSFLATSTSTSPSWPVKHASVMEGNVILGGLMMVHSREDSITCGPIMPQGGIQALEAMLYTLDQVNKQHLLPNITLGAHILDDCDKDTYGLEMAVDFIKGKSKSI